MTAVVATRQQGAGISGHVDRVNRIVAQNTLIHVCKSLESYVLNLVDPRVQVQESGELRINRIIAQNTLIHVRQVTGIVLEARQRQ